MHAIDHPTAGNENDQAFTFNYRVTDGNGDTIDGTLGLTVNDDSPVVSANAPIAFDEDALTGGNLGGIGDSNPATNGPITASGTLAHSTVRMAQGLVAGRTGAPRDLPMP